MQEILKTLEMDWIYSLIQPFSELGIKEKQDFIEFKEKDIEIAKSYYGELSDLLHLINQDQAALPYLSSILTHFEDIRNILRKEVIIFEMHEIFQIKHFLYFYLKLSNYLKIRTFAKNLFKLLDRDGQNTPTFYLSPEYSVKYKELKNNLFTIQANKEEALQIYYENIMNHLQIKSFEEVITISRFDEDKINKLLNSGFFYMSDENFANITLSLKKAENIMRLEEQIVQLNLALELEANNIRKNLSEKINKFKTNILCSLAEVARFDLKLAKVVFARSYSCVIPELHNNKTMSINLKNVFNIVLHKQLQINHIDYQRININISKYVNIITGSNMGGKTSLLKTIGQTAMMVKLGLPVPAECAKIPIFDNVFFCGPSTSQDRSDLSSFGLEVVTLQSVIDYKGFNLFLMDEFARGTNPVEGEALYHSVIRYFAQISRSIEKNETILISTTHYNLPNNISNLSHFQMVGLHEDCIAELESKHHSVSSKLQLINKYMNYQPIEVTDETQIPQSAILIAKLLGLAKEITSNV